MEVRKMKTTVHVRASISDDENNIVLKVDKQQKFEKTEDNMDIYCQLFNLLSDVQYCIVESSGQEIDDFF